jgi:hypothetical protein
MNNPRIALVDASKEDLPAHILGTVVSCHFNRADAIIAELDFALDHPKPCRTRIVKLRNRLVEGSLVNADWRPLREFP